VLIVLCVIMAECMQHTSVGLLHQSSGHSLRATYRETAIADDAVRGLVRMIYPDKSHNIIREWRCVIYYPGKIQVSHLGLTIEASE